VVDLKGVMGNLIQAGDRGLFDDRMAELQALGDPRQHFEAVID
jgi:hypothetical protein